MLIMIDNLQCIIELKSFTINKELKPHVCEKVNDIKNRIMSHAYSIGSTDAAERKAKLEVDAYLCSIDNKYEYSICINKSYSIKDTTEKGCETIYNQIKESIQNNQQFCVISNNVEYEE